MQNVSAGGNILNVLSAGLRKHSRGFIKTQLVVMRLQILEKQTDLNNNLCKARRWYIKKTLRENERSTPGERI